jgi:NAD(P)H-dependent FMN reductase
VYRSNPFLETSGIFQQMTKPLQVLCVVGTSAAQSATHTVVGHIAHRFRTLGADVDVFDPSKEPLLLFNPESSYAADEFMQLKERVEKADAYVLGTPDYHGSISSTLKNFLDHFWQEFTGKLFAQIVCSQEKGLTVIDQLRTVARQCYAWTLPYGVSFATTDLKDGDIISAALDERIEMLVNDLQVYGLVLRQQRRADLSGVDPGFLARIRPDERVAVAANGASLANLSDFAPQT